MSATALAGRPGALEAPGSSLAAGGAASLGNNANNCGGEARRARRAAQYDARSWLWGSSSIERVQKCGRVRTGAAVSLDLVGDVGTSQARASWSGLTRCGSVHVCPVCSSRVMASRADELVAALDSWHAQGGAVAMVTLTMRHQARDSLDDLWGALSPAWAACSAKNSAIKRARRSAGVAGFVRVVEATHGANGWHLHAHALAFLDAPPEPAALDGLADAMWSGWRAALVKRGLPAPSREHGCVVKLLDLAQARQEVGQYVTKATYESAALEVAGGATKQAGRGNRTPWQLLDAATNGEKRARALWSEWERVSHGKKAHTWGRGLRDRLGLGDDASDDERAADDDAAEELTRSTAAVFMPEGWAAITRARGAPAALLDAAEQGGGLAVVLALERLGCRPPPGSFSVWADGSRLDF